MGCMSARGVGNIHFIDVIMDNYEYVYNAILKTNVKQSAIKMGMSNVPTDSNSKHNPELKWQWLIWNIPKQLKTLAQSPDLKPIKHLWAILKRGVHKLSIKSKNHLKRIVIREWESIGPKICRNLVNFMHRRCVSVIRAKGYAIKY